MGQSQDLKGQGHCGTVKDQIRGKIEFENQFNPVIPHLIYSSSIKQVLSSIETTPVTASSIKTLCLKRLNEISSQQIYCQLIKHLYQAPTSQNKWVEYYPFLDTINWKFFYSLPGKILRATYLLSLQYKILHRVFNCRHKLFLWKMIESPNCLECGEIDHLEHFFYYCESSRRFWIYLENWLSNIFSKPVKFTILEILLGCIHVDTLHIYDTNYTILYGKYFINKHKKSQKEIYWDHYCRALKSNLVNDHFPT